MVASACRVAGSAKGAGGGWADLLCGAGAFVLARVAGESAGCGGGAGVDESSPDSVRAGSANRGHLSCCGGAADVEGVPDVRRDVLDAALEYGGILFYGDQWRAL